MRTKPGEGFGTIYYNRQRNRYSAQYMEYSAKNGKYQKKTKTFKTREDAEKYLSTVMYQKDNSLYNENNGIPLCEFMKSNLKQKLDTNQISPTQYGRVQKTIEQIEKFPIGSKMIDEITSDEIQAYLNEHIHLSNSTLSKLYGQFNQTFKRAMDKGYLMKNPMIEVLKPRSKKPTKVVRALTVDEQKLFTDFLINQSPNGCKYKNVFLIQMYMGLRCGEALALTNHDIDLEHKLINIHRTLTTDEIGGVIMGNSTKTYAGRRVVPIPDFMIPHLIEQMKIAKNNHDNPEKLLFKPEFSNYADRNNANSELKRILLKYFRITDISTHSLRHTYGTRCIEAGMAPVVVQKLMGHNDVLITLNTYTTVFDKYKAKEVDKLNEYYLEENIGNGNKLLSNYVLDEKEEERNEK